MIRISNISFFRFCWENGKLDWPKCARTSHALATQKFLTLRPWKTRFLLKPFLLNDSQQFDVNIIEVYFI